MAPVQRVAQTGLDPLQQSVMALLVIQDQPHHQSDHRVAAGHRKLFVLHECVSLGTGMPINCVQQPLNRARLRPVLWLDLDWQTIEPIDERRFWP